MLKSEVCSVSMAPRKSCCSNLRRSWFRLGCRSRECGPSKGRDQLGHHFSRAESVSRRASCASFRMSQPPLMTIPPTTSPMIRSGSGDLKNMTAAPDTTMPALATMSLVENIQDAFALVPMRAQQAQAEHIGCGVCDRRNDHGQTDRLCAHEEASKYLHDQRHPQDDQNDAGQTRDTHLRYNRSPNGVDADGINSRIP